MRLTVRVTNTPGPWPRRHATSSLRTKPGLTSPCGRCDSIAEVCRRVRAPTGNALDDGHVPAERATSKPRRSLACCPGGQSTPGERTTPRQALARWRARARQVKCPCRARPERHRASTSVGTTRTVAPRGHTGRGRRAATTEESAWLDSRQAPTVDVESIRQRPSGQGCGSACWEKRRMLP